jgi:crossover junction endodeoxyribonuclease RusA
VNVLYGTARNGQKFLTAEQRQFRARTAEIVRAANRDAFAGRLEMSVTLYFANRRRADIDNRLKAVFDACTHGGAYHDDSQIDVLHVERVVRPGAEEECTVRIGELAA